VKVDCRQLCDLLFDYINNDLSEERRQLLEEHLRVCPPCLVYAESYRVTVTLSRKLPCRDLPPECERRLREALARECAERMNKDA
jgi:hypothetical protein